MLASASGALAYGPDRTTLSAEVSLSVAPSAAIGYGLRWRVDGDALPFLETHWARYAVFADAPLFRPSYAEGVRGYLPTLRVERQVPATGTGWVRGHVVLPSGHRGVAAAVHASTGGVSDAQAGGGFFVGPLEPGDVSLSAVAQGYLGGPTGAVIVAGEETVTRIDLRAVPVPDAGAWSTDSEALQVDFGLGHFDVAPSDVSLSVRAEGDGEVLGSWSGEAALGTAKVTFVASQLDGAQMVPSLSLIHI